ncbi:helix-turn-helix transcriptional regulator [Marispirochaeta aestuarii]|uniref:response regulator transcription factor n=1 Tax=Marispirochaeta aestuarii TaxID=1963862 RepID=UPI0029C92189|nr:helix-turn-helix transcriptional regulator [Marispirochaeta aestuarii]
MNHMLFIYFLATLSFGFFTLGVTLVSYLRIKSKNLASLLIFQGTCLISVTHLVLRFYFGALLPQKSTVLIPAMDFFEAYIVKLILFLLPPFFFTLQFFKVPKRGLKFRGATVFIGTLVFLDILFERIINDGEGRLEQFGEILVYSLSLAFLILILSTAIRFYRKMGTADKLARAYIILLSLFTVIYALRDFLGGSFSLNAFPLFSVFLSYLALKFIGQPQHSGRLENIQVEDGWLNRLGISNREREVLRLLIQGRSTREIGDMLCISINTVKTHIRNIYSKFMVRSRWELASRLRITRDEYENHPEG